MNTLKQSVVAGLVGLILAVSPATTSAQELPTGAARLVEKVQTRIFISQANLGFHIAAILENQPSPGGGE